MILRPAADPGAGEPPGDAPGAETERRLALIRTHLDDGVPLGRAAREAGVPARTARRWLARYRLSGVQGLERAVRSDRGSRRLPAELVQAIEGLALRRPQPSIATVHRRACAIARDQGWPEPAYDTVRAIVRAIDPAMLALAHEGDRRYREAFELVHRRAAAEPNEIWQADHTELDLWVRDPAGRPGRPWLTLIEDDYSRAVAGYAVSLEAPSALGTALALRQAIWRKSESDWHVCGIPAVFYTDHGPDFTSRHMEQVAADLKMQLVFSLPGRPRGRGKIERLFGTVNQMCLPELPGYAPRGAPDRAEQAQLTLPELDAAIGRFIREAYHRRDHSETGEPPQLRWDKGGLLPRMPESLEQLDLLLLYVQRPRKVHADGIHFQGLRYLDPLLAAYVGESVTIRYDPRDLAEIRVFHGERFLARALCPELAGAGIALKDLAAARNARRRELTGGIRARRSLIDRLLAVHEPQPGRRSPPPSARTDAQPGFTLRLKRYREE